MRSRSDSARWTLLALLLCGAAQAGLVVNPGFEQGMFGWNFYDNGGQNNQYVDTNVSHSGQNSGALLLRWYGGQIEQDIAVNLPVGTPISLSWWQKQPYPGTHENKWYGGGLIAFDAQGGYDVAGVEQFNPLPDWTQQQVSLVTTRPVVKLRIAHGTGAGNGNYSGRDRIVWIDDHVLTIPDSPVPEPGTLAVLAVGMASVARRRRRR